MKKHLQWAGPTEFLSVPLPKMMGRGYSEIGEGDQHRALIYRNVNGGLLRRVLNTYVLEDCVGVNLVLSSNETVFTTRYAAALLGIYLKDIDDSTLLRKVIKVTHPDPLVVQRTENAILAAYVGISNTKSNYANKVSDYLRSL